MLGGGWVGKYIYTNEAIGIDNYGTIVITSRQIRYTGNHDSELVTLTKADYEEKATEQESKMCFNQHTKRSVPQKYVWLTTKDILC